MIEFLLLSLTVVAFVPVYWRLVGVNLSVSSVLLGAIWLVYGFGYLAYSRVLGPGVFEHLFAPEPSRDAVDYLTCGRSLGQYHFLLQTAINLPIIRTMDLAVCLMLLGLLIGCRGADAVFSNTSSHLRAAMDRWDTERSDAVDPACSNTMALVYAAALTFMLYFMVRDHQISKVWLYFVSQASEFEKIAMRQTDGGSNSYFFNLMLSTVLPFICFYLVALKKQGHRLYLALALLFVGLLVLAKLAMLSKAPVVVFFVQLCLVIQLRKSIRFGAATGWTVLIAIITLLVMISVANPDLEGLEAVGFLLYRIFMAPNEALLEFFAAIPYVIPHTWGEDNRFLAFFLQIPPLEATYSRVSEAFRGVKGYTTNVMFLGDAWAQFRWLGVLGVSMLAGFAFRWVDIRLIVVMGKSAAAIAGLALAYFAAFTALSTALQTAFLTGGLLMVVPLVWAFSRVSSRSPQVLTP
jgi:hypothetical protein